MRTVPTDKWQVEALVDLLKEFKWNWVAVVASEDEYGRQGQRQFSALASERRICVAYEGLIPIYRDPVPTIREILEHIKETRVGVVVLFSLPQPATEFFTEVSLRVSDRVRGTHSVQKQDTNSLKKELIEGITPPPLKKAL